MMYDRSGRYMMSMYDFSGSQGATMMRFSVRVAFGLIVTLSASSLAAAQVVRGAVTSASERQPLRAFRQISFGATTSTPQLNLAPQPDAMPRINPAPQPDAAPRPDAASRT